MVLVLLVQLWAMQGATGLSIQQGPKSLWVRQGSQVTLACQVAQTQAWERLRVGWTKDGDVMCQPYITNSSLSLGVCGPRGQLSWLAPGDLTLRLDRVSMNDSGDYVCWAATEIPELEEAEGNGTQLVVEAGPLLVVLAAGFVAVAAVALGAVIWGRRRCGEKDSGNPFYSNVLYRPRGAPKKSEAWPGERKVLDTPRENQRGQSVYSLSFPQPATPHGVWPPKPCPSQRPSQTTSTITVSPGPGPSGQPRPEGSL
ncbi:PREDICTED: transmembrane and immunoglobulin domain-containing protein 2 [Galeopterus variegatus]|uniref:transmembrane and immunoglobulin domain-containing protein 2 n=1 Tax=Galeopterus variegatus TaxID=482537 RepID=UPI0004D046ED|nr:PREDICTED: transmembrane and immunoglobulin domain-containing protein 2 [Galeopterus variegatus]